MSKKNRRMPPVPIGHDDRAEERQKIPPASPSDGGRQNGSDPAAPDGVSGDWS